MVFQHILVTQYVNNKVVAGQDNSIKNINLPSELYLLVIDRG